MKNKHGHIGQYSIELFEREDFDWQYFRNQAAKDILCALITHYGEALNDTVKDSVLYADALITKLKEKEEK